MLFVGAPERPASSTSCGTPWNFVSYKDRKVAAAALKGHLPGGRCRLLLGGRSPSLRTASRAVAYPAIGQSWRRAWGEVVPFYAFPAEARRILYTTNAVEALNAKLRRAVRVHRSVSGDVPA